MRQYASARFPTPCAIARTQLPISIASSLDRLQAWHREAIVAPSLEAIATAIARADDEPAEDAPEA